jgi:hypothetical protein
MSYLNDKIIAYLAVNNISVGAKDFETAQPEGGEDAIESWNESKLGPIPTQEQLDAAWTAKESADAAVVYKAQRTSEYPDFRDYLDGIVKGDQSQVQAYIDACLAVKAKYPKPGA